ncbi:ABC-F family ATP-binding cassette domain-containing protein [Candidatus Jorgensenbacteria bacterium]|nr:ABC-F family ATP-binding cassette domain-containing protein [Candidatus Jorgensenbacteria bacterium]
MNKKQNNQKDSELGKTALIANHGDVIMRFDKVYFNYDIKPILSDVSFGIREGAKITLMGQNGAGKTTMFDLIMSAHLPEDGSIHIKKGLTIAQAMQVMPREDLAFSIRDFFQSAFTEKVYDIDPRIEEVLEIVHLTAPFEKKISEFSGGEQARLLLAYALIQKPDILLLDEPTNNLDKQGVDHLTKFLIDYKNTCIVISHDAKFLNAFTHGVLYLDSRTHKVEYYVGNYLDVVGEITARIERERMKNVRLEREISNRKEQANFFAQKGGHMRDVAKKMNKKIEELEGQLVETREEDKTIRDFFIPAMLLSEPIVNIGSVSVMHNHKATAKKVNIVLKKGDRLLVAGPNGIGKTSLLKSMAGGKSKGTSILKEASIGYYAQDFSRLDMNISVYKALSDVMQNGTEEQLRSVASQFLLSSEILKNKVESLSEGQKGLLCFAQFVLQRPALLILDEPTNHINFRHLPVIARALNKYEGAMILISHMSEFVEEVKVTQTLDLGEL